MKKKKKDWTKFAAGFWTVLTSAYIIAWIYFGVFAAKFISAFIMLPTEDWTVKAGVMFIFAVAICAYLFFWCIPGLIGLLKDTAKEYWDKLEVKEK